MKKMLLNLYLPITSQPRELDSKLLLALFAAERGFTVTLGYKSVLRTRSGCFAPGFFLLHNARQKVKKIIELKKLGHQISVLDEEALIRQSDQIFLKKHSSDAFEHIEKVFTWGNSDLKLWKDSNFEIQNKLLLVGNPRIDLLRPELRSFYAIEADKLKEKFGDFILINTNFPTVNNLTPQGGGVHLNQTDGSKRIEENVKSFLENKRRLFLAFQALIPALAKDIFPFRLVIRPHPNENHGPWIELARDLSNVSVEFDHSAIPWIMASKALIHNGCTTAIEARVLHVPVINYRPWRSEWDNSLSMRFGIDCKDQFEIISALRKLMGSSKDELQDNTELKYFIHNVDGRFCSELIVDSFLGMQERKVSADSQFLKRLLYCLRSLILRSLGYVKMILNPEGRQCHKFLKDEWHGLSRWNLDHEMMNSSVEQLHLLKRQFSTIDRSIIMQKIERFSQSLNRFKDIDVITKSPFYCIVKKRG